MSGPARGRRKRVKLLRAVLPCLALIGLDGTPARAQTITPDLFRPVRDGFVTAQNSPLRRIGDKPGDSAADPTDPANDPKLRDKDTPAPSRSLGSLAGSVGSAALSPGLSPILRSGEFCAVTKPSRTGRNRSGVMVWA